MFVDKEGAPIGGCDVGVVVEDRLRGAVAVVEGDWGFIR